MIFKIAALLILLVAVYLLYRIAFPKQPKQAVQRDNDIPERKTKHVSGVVGKSRFVLPDRSKPLQTAANTAVREESKEKEIMFAPETDTSAGSLNEFGIIPPEKLDEVFEDEINPDDLDIDDDDDDADDDTEIDLEAEEALEQENRVEGQNAMLAEGLNFDDLHDVAMVVKEQPETVSEKTAATMTALEHTDMFELLASGDEGKANWIKSIIERHIQNSEPETESTTETEDEISETDYSNFDVADFIGQSRTIKK